MVVLNMRGKFMKKYNITVNGTVYEVEVEEIAADSVSAPEVPVSKPAAKAPPAPAKPAKPAAQNRPADSGKSGDIKINAPMPGTILKINVTAGQQIKKGETLCLLEAMKMENEIVSPSDAVVATVDTRQGASVQTGELLFSLN